MTKPQHPYPSNHRPGTHWATDKAWEILNTLPVGQLRDDQRFFIAGMIAGALSRVAGERGLFPDLAQEIADRLDRVIPT